jgi:serine phosphatase RsbU (regulator of sigma subunit)
MKIRIQLVLACFLLSVLPLTAIVVYSYYASRRALEKAYHGEAVRLSAQMDRRLSNIRNEIEQRLAELSALPHLPGPGPQSDADVRSILLTMGDAASLVDSLEIQPIRVQHAPEVPRPVEVHAEAAPKPAAAPAPAPQVTLKQKHVEINVEDLEPIVIDLPPMPKMPKFQWTDEERAQLKEIQRLSQELARAQALTPEQRAETQRQLDTVQKAFNANMKVTQEVFQQQLSEALRARETARQIRDRQRQRALEDRVREREADRAAEQADKAAEKNEEKIAEAAASVGTTPAVAAVAPPPPTPPAEVRVKSALSAAEKAKMQKREKEATLVFGQKFNVPLRSKGALVGQLTAHVSSEEVIRRVLGAASEDGSEIAFAIDREGNVYTRTAADRAILDRLGVADRIARNQPLGEIKNWVVGVKSDPQSGLRVGVARPFGENLEELRNTAAKNFGYGIALVFVALIGIVPIANHITRDVQLVTRGAERIAGGDLMTRLPVKSNNEFGHLAAAFNRMAEDLSLQQQTIVEQERTRKEQEMQQRILAIEYDRKSDELEEARRFQLSMLPKEVPHLDRYDIAVFTQTATEVGGDYYDFHVAGDAGLSVTVGDATGHGATAGTMVTVIKALFAGYAPEVSPAHFLRDAAEKVKRMDLGRMAMALILARFDGRRVTLASAGMPPAYVHRRSSGSVDEISIGATPLGTLGADYNDISVILNAGDTMLFMTDGFPELLNADGQQLGYPRAMQEFASAATAPDADGVIASLATSARQWHGEQPPNDDVTFVVVRARA